MSSTDDEPWWQDVVTWVWIGSITAGVLFVLCVCSLFYRRGKQVVERRKRWALAGYSPTG